MPRNRRRPRLHFSREPDHRCIRFHFAEKEETPDAVAVKMA